MSIVMAVKHLPGQWTTQAIHSLALQSVAPSEVVVIVPRDDHSVEYVETALRLHGMRSRLIFTEEGRGLTHDRNIGLLEARGKYVCLIDGDDVCLPNKLWLETKIAENTRATAVFTDYFYTDENLNITGRWEGAPPTLAALRERCCIPDWALVRRDALSRLGYLDERFGIAAVYDLWLRLFEETLRGEGKMLHRATPTHLYRQREGAMSQDKTTQAPQIDMKVAVLRAHYERMGEPVPKDLAFDFVDTKSDQNMVT